MFRATRKVKVRLLHSDEDISIETERRFLVRDHSIVQGAPSEYIVQAYVFATDGFAIRIRHAYDELADPSTAKATLTAKGPRVGDQREEYEVSVSPEWAYQVIERAEHVMHKRRFQVITDQTWEIDQFLDQNDGLWIAELEGGDAIRSVPVPDWATREIVDEPDLNNESLALRPIAAWTEPERVRIDLRPES